MDHTTQTLRDATRIVQQVLDQTSPDNPATRTLLKLTIAGLAAAAALHDHRTHPDPTTTDLVA